MRRNTDPSATRVKAISRTAVWRSAAAALCTIAALASARPADAGQDSAQAASTTPLAAPKPRPTGRVSVYVDSWSSIPDEGVSRSFRTIITTATFRAPETESDGIDYGVDVRHSGLSGGTRPDRFSLYEGFVGARAADGHLRVRGGHLWLNDFGSLGSLAGGHVEFRQKDAAQEGIGRLRIGAFGGLEPKILDTGYYSGVKKFGVYGALDGAAGRRHSAGYVQVRDQSLTERSVLTTTNFVPVGRTFFLYQAAEYDLAKPAGEASAGLNYFYTNARVNPTARVELQGTYNRGRSIDTRGLADDVLNGRPISQSAALGLAYESRGGRVTVEPIARVRVYFGYTQDKSSREDKPANRTMIGGYAPNVGGSGLDIAASDTRTIRSNGNYHSSYVSVGRQVGRRAYVSGDYTTSLSVIRFSRSDGLVVEDRPSTRRVSGTGSINVGPATSIQITVDHTWDTDLRELRILSGLSYRFR